MLMFSFHNYVPVMNQFSPNQFTKFEDKNRRGQLFHDGRSPAGLEDINPNPDLLSHKRSMDEVPNQ